MSILQLPHMALNYLLATYYNLLASIVGHAKKGILNSSVSSLVLKKIEIMWGKKAKLNFIL